MANLKLPPQVDEENLKASLRAMNEYLFYLREQMQYELDLIKNKKEEVSDGKK